MKKDTEFKENIIQATINLIQKSNGDINKITTRDIAKNARVGNGLINYHFGTKENLINSCIERMIGDIVKNYNPNLSECNNIEEELIMGTTKVFDFLFKNPAIYRMSMLYDYTNPKENNNTIKSQKIIMKSIGNNMNELDKAMYSFILVSVMQTAFLTAKLNNEMSGFKLDTTESRKEFIEKLVKTLLYGIKKEKDEE